MKQTEQESQAPHAEDKKDSRNRVAELLQAPRRKRKSYVVLAMANGPSSDLSMAVQQYVRTNFKQLLIANPATIDELEKSLTKQVALLIFDDEFMPVPKAMELFFNVKTRVHDQGMPILFLTRDPSALIEAYHTKLSAFHEVDDYLNRSQVTVAEVLSQVRHALTFGSKRRSRRYKIELAVDYEVLGDPVKKRGRLIDMSIHGARLRDESGRIFKASEQLRLQIPGGKSLSLSYGEYLKVACRVRRVFVVGSDAGVSFEFLTSEQRLALTQLVTSIANNQNVKRSAQQKTA